MERQIVEEIVKKVLAALAIPVGVSNRHIHLSAEHMQVLFGSGHTLTKEKDLKQVGEFAAQETVTLIGPKGTIQGVRVLGPVRGFTQIELARTDGYTLGVVPPVRDSGQIKGSAGIVIAGPCGVVHLQEGVICAARHIHMQEEDARRFGVADGERVTVEVPGSRGGTFSNVLVRVHPNFRLEFHIDTDEANAAGLKNGDTVTLQQGGDVNTTVNLAKALFSALVSTDTSALFAGKAAESFMPVPEKSVVPQRQHQTAERTAKKTVVDAETVKQAKMSGSKAVTVAKGDIITPLARDIARDYGIEIRVEPC